MSLFDVEALMAPVTSENPCGPDLRAEPEFRDIEDAPGGFASLKPPELLKVVKLCAEVLTRTKDQMPAIVAAQAAVRAGSLSTANAALEFVAGITDAEWDGFHPGPAEEMVIGRVNELSALARPAAMLLPLQRLAMASLPAPSETEFNAAMLAQALVPVKAWSGEDEERLKAQTANGTLTAAAARSVKPTQEGAKQLRGIMVALSDASRAADTAAETLPAGFDAAQTRPLAIILRDQVAARRADLQSMSDLLYTIAEVYEKRASDSPSFGPVHAQLKQMIGNADLFLEQFPDPNAVVEAPADADGDTEAAAGESSAGGAATAAAKPRGFSGDTPRNRADVLVAIDAINRYYAEHEPTSPVPLMLKRMREWVEMDFIRLLREIAPSSVDEAGKLLAIRPE